MANALEELLKRVDDEDLRQRLRAEIKARSTGVGLVWEKHLPESVTLPGLPIRAGRRVMVLPPRGVDADALRSSRKKADREKVDPLWGTEWVVRELDGADQAVLVEGPVDLLENGAQELVHPVEDLVSVARFDEPVYPGLTKTGEVRRGADGDPEHVVINAENYHALQALRYTHAGMIDAIYIDPPYNTGAKDWKYNNAFVDGEDRFRHSKWLSFMERRLLVAKELLNPEDSVLIVTIDEKEYLNLGILLRQTFPEARIQMVSSVINPTGAVRGREFARTDEYLYFVQVGVNTGSLRSYRGWAEGGPPPSDNTFASPYWRNLCRGAGSKGRRVDRPKSFYPIMIKETNDGLVFSGWGAPLELHENRHDMQPGVDEIVVWPLMADGSESRWQVSGHNLEKLINDGFVRIRKTSSGYVIQYLADGERKKVSAGIFSKIDSEISGAGVFKGVSEDTVYVPTQWNIPSHSARHNGTSVIKALHGDKRFTYPKSLYAVEDALRFFVANKPNATILDFFAGSGTTAHAVMRLNKQDGGRRRSISVTNNEVSADEQHQLLVDGHRPGDEEWDRLGIADYVTKPRIEAAITGRRASDGQPVKGRYKFTDEFDMADGFEANASFWTLSYLDPAHVEVGLAFGQIAPLLWLAAGQTGSVIEQEDPDGTGYALADTYAVLFDGDALGQLVAELNIPAHRGIAHVFVVTDHDAEWQEANTRLPDRLTVHRLYESYLRNFEIEGGA